MHQKNKALSSIQNNKMYSTLNNYNSTSARTEGISVDLLFVNNENVNFNLKSVYRIFLYILFLLFAIGSTNAAVLYNETENTIYIFGGGWENLTTINSSIANSTVLNEESPKIWFLNANLMVNDSITTLYINDTDCNTLKINSTSGTAYWVNVTGTFYAKNVTITSWNVTIDAPDTIVSGQKRSWVVLSGNVGIENITAQYLGHTVGSVPTCSYWNTITGFALNQTNSYGIIENSKFLYNAYGFTFYKTSNKTFRYNNVTVTTGRGLQMCNYPSPYTGNNNSFLNNIFHSDTNFGVRLENAGDYNKFYNNIIEGGAVGIEIYNVNHNHYFENNTITATSYGGNVAGILLASGSHHVFKNNIVKTTSSKAKAAIEIGYNAATINVTFNNTIIKTNSNYYQGIYITFADGIYFDNTTIYGVPSIPHLISILTTPYSKQTSESPPLLTGHNHITLN